MGVGQTGSQSEWVRVTGRQVAVGRGGERGGERKGDIAAVVDSKREEMMKRRARSVDGGAGKSRRIMLCPFS